MNTTKAYHRGAWGLVVFCAACQASAPSQELLTARDMYAKTRDSVAAQIDPEGVRQAHAALRSAEAAHEDSAGSRRERSYAYLSLRKSELALARAREGLARRAYLGAAQARAAIPYAHLLMQARGELEHRRRHLLEALSVLVSLQAELSALQARSEADGQGMVNRTGVFFDTGSAELSPLARSQLDIVATLLMARPHEETVIEGYADAQGDEQHNLELSQKRADAVREYLVSRGVAPDRLRAEGRGASHPLADNDTPAGRASNRRVEIATHRDSAEQLPDPSRQNVRGTDDDSADDPQTEPPEEQSE